jgi:hypothetical protein
MKMKSPAKVVLREYSKEVLAFEVFQGSGAPCFHHSSDSLGQPSWHAEILLLDTLEADGTFSFSIEFDRLTLLFVHEKVQCFHGGDS